MGCNRTSVSRLGRKKYGIVNNLQENIQYISNKNIEIENLIVEFLDNSTKTIVFDKPFSGVPSVVANFIASGLIPNVNVYVESILPNQVVIRTSAPVSGQIHVHAMYIES